MDNDAALNLAWRSNRTWAATSRALKTELDRWSTLAFQLAAAGAVLAAAAQEMHLASPKPGPGVAAPEWAHWLDFAAKAFGFVGALAVALSAYFAREALGGGKTSDWVKARGAAESLKACLYLYRTGAPPFDGADRAKALLGRVEAVENTVAQIAGRAPKQEAVPDLGPLTLEQYIAARIDDQIDNYYDPRVLEYQRKNDRFRSLSLWLGAASVLLGAVSTQYTSALVGLVATLTSSLSSYAQSHKYQTLALLYQATSGRLRLLKAEWAADGKTDADTTERNAFIRRCEDALALESSAWTGQWSSKTPAVKNPPSLP